MRCAVGVGVELYWLGMLCSWSSWGNGLCVVCVDEMIDVRETWLEMKERAQVEKVALGNDCAFVW